MTTSGSAPTMATADLLIGLLDRVPLSEAQIARATLADPATIQAWLRRRQAPAGLEAQRVTELVAFVEEMARNVKGETLAGWWLDGNIDFLSGANPLDEIAAGRLRADDPVRARRLTTASSRRTAGILHCRGNT